jgi:PTS system N-acetylglucosamine-specific IIC component
MDVQTVGRDGTSTVPAIRIRTKDKKSDGDKKDKYVTMAESIIEIIGHENIKEIANCATRLRLIVKDNKDKKLDEKKFKALGIYGVVKQGSEGLQLIVGVDVEHVANAMVGLHKK